MSGATSLARLLVGQTAPCAILPTGSRPSNALLIYQHSPRCQVATSRLKQPPSQGAVVLGSTQPSTAYLRCLYTESASFLERSSGSSPRSRGVR
jgi:hypothetical protein